MTGKPKDRTRARALCAEFTEHGDDLGWFEALYREAHGNEAIIPWADMVPNPHLCEWLRETGFDLRDKRCLKIGCGLGDDAEYLASAGGNVAAFDISPTAIEWCQLRFPTSAVTYLTADLFAAPTAWRGAFDFVLESYTLQVFPRDKRYSAMRHIADFVASSGVLLVICRGRDENEPKGSMPWPLTRQELQAFSAWGLRELSFEDYTDTETPPVRRFRALYQRKAGQNRGANAPTRAAHGQR